MSRKKILISVIILLVAGLIAATGIVKSGRNTNQNLHSTVKSDLIDVNGQPVQFADLKGKVVFINNWASWCPPCIAEMPSIQQLKNKLKGENIVFVMVSFDEDRDKATAFMKKKGYDFEVYYPGNKYSFLTESIPTTFILDKTGRLISEHTGMADYSEDEVVTNLKELIDGYDTGK
jgi:thiol-disulfide isomerase/thioredoxin